MIDTLVYENKDSLSAIALLEKKELKEIEFSDSNGVSEESVYLGKVTHKLDLANGKTGFFINIGDTQDAFLNTDEQGLDDDKITEGQSLVVQVSSERRAEKGAKVIRSIKLAGRNLVYCPYMMGVQVSSKIRQHPGVEDYRQLVSDNITGQEGWILRTSSVEVEPEVILDEMVELRNLYEDIRKKARVQKAPSLLYTKGSPLQKYINIYKSSINTIVVNSHNVEKELKEEYGGEFDIVYSKNPFDDYGLDEAINDALYKEVKLKNGGRITIEETKAFVAIDVDSGDGNGAGSISSLNSDAAREIVKQIRLRNLSGKIIIDFAGSGEYKYMKPVLDILAEELENDANKSYLVGLSKAGNVEIVRTRHRPSLQELLTVECETCLGTGRVSR
ncbi:MAG: ribonuclease E/G [Lactobacillaceae bacterium]|jgi:ribonuclease G|nr:ribonuclease E/G [Lactobacillaceae bacterium]